MLRLIVFVYDYNYIKKGKTIHKLKSDSQTTCYFAKPINQKKGIVNSKINSFDLKVFKIMAIKNKELYN